MLPNFILAKSINTFNNNLITDYLYLTSEEIKNKLNQVELIKTKNGLFLISFNQILWLKQITLEDYSTICFVQEQFSDDYWYCYNIRKQYFNNKAKDIKKLYS